MSAPASYSTLARILILLPDLHLEARRQRGLSLRQAAAQSGVSYSTLHRLEAGHAGCTLEHAIAVLRWLDQTTGDTHP